MWPCTSRAMQRDGCYRLCYAMHYMYELRLKHTKDACQPKTFPATHDDLKLLRKRNFSTVVIPRCRKSHACIGSKGFVPDVSSGRSILCKPSLCTSKAFVATLISRSVHLKQWAASNRLER